MAQDHTRPDAATTGTEEDEAQAEHSADRPPTPEEEAAAEKNEPDPEVAEHYREAIETGAEVQGEGEVA